MAHLDSREEWLNLLLFFQVSVGVSVALSLPVHAVVCLLVLGCCPTGMLAPILAVLQQAHVELALLLGFLESTMAFGKLSEDTTSTENTNPQAWILLENCICEGSKIPNYPHTWMVKVSNNLT